MSASDDDRPTVPGAPAALGALGAPPAVVVDTNVFVAAGFRRASASARLLAALRRGGARLVWNDATRQETERVVRRIPPLRWDDVAPLFREADRHAGSTDPAAFTAVPDPDDREFAALAAAADATLVTMDEHLLGARGAVPATIRTPGEFLRTLEEPAAR